MISAFLREEYTKYLSMAISRQNSTGQASGVAYGDNDERIRESEILLRKQQEKTIVPILRLHKYGEQTN